MKHTLKHTAASFLAVLGISTAFVQAEIPEKQIGLVETRFPSAGSAQPVDLSFILYSQSAHTFHTRIERREQISAVAYPREKDNVFIVSLNEASGSTKGRGTKRSLAIKLPRFIGRSGTGRVDPKNLLERV